MSDVKSNNFIYPDWPAPSNVKAVMTTRHGGVSVAPFDSMNLGTHVDDSTDHVKQNRELLSQVLSLPSPPLWLNQVHGTKIANHKDDRSGCDADAIGSSKAGEVCAIMTADCLPVLFCNRQGTRVAAAHAGWRGLQSGILEKCVTTMNCKSEEILVWLGAAIGPSAFEVGGEVREAFTAVYSESASAFVRNPNNQSKWLADIYQLAKIHLSASGIEAGNIYGGEGCTFSDESLYFSYRRENRTGRMASLIWLT